MIEKLPVSDRRWHVAEDHVPYGSESELCPGGRLKPDTFRRF